MPENVVVDIYGKFACFTRSNAKVERVSYDAPTPSAWSRCIGSNLF